jgi:hypothetical protein
MHVDTSSRTECFGLEDSGYSCEISSVSLEGVKVNMLQELYEHCLCIRAQAKAKAGDAHRLPKKKKTKNKISEDLRRRT